MKANSTNDCPCSFEILFIFHFPPPCIVVKKNSDQSPRPMDGGSELERFQRLNGAGNRVDSCLNGIAQAAPSHGQQHADHDHGENERILDERLTLLATEPREQ
jgi:hypothetical protein